MPRFPVRSAKLPIAIPSSRASKSPIANPTRRRDGPRTTAPARLFGLQFADLDRGDAALEGKAAGGGRLTLEFSLSPRRHRRPPGNGEGLVRARLGKRRKEEFPGFIDVRSADEKSAFGAHARAFEVVEQPGGRHHPGAGAEIHALDRRVGGRPRNGARGELRDRVARAPGALIALFTSVSLLALRPLRTERTLRAGECRRRPAAQFRRGDGTLPDLPRADAVLRQVRRRVCGAATQEQEQAEGGDDIRVGELASQTPNWVPSGASGQGGRDLASLSHRDRSANCQQAAPVGALRAITMPF